jgi:hypothetical protein
MTRTRFLVGGLAVLVALAAAPRAEAQATRTWVSGVGDDANPCSRTAPCKTFAGAISKTAPGGEIDVLDPGGFGALTITKSISIEAEGVVAGVLVSGTNGINVSAGPTDVVLLRGLTFEGLGTGLDAIQFNSGGALYVEDCFANHFTGSGINFQPSGFARLYVTNSRFRDMGAYGILVKPGSTASAPASLNQVFVSNSLAGIRAEDGASVVANETVASGNRFNGFTAVSTSRSVTLSLTNSVASGNGEAGVHAVGPLAEVTIGVSSVFGNQIGLFAETGSNIVSFANSRVAGNVTDGIPTLTAILK